MTIPVTVLTGFLGSGKTTLLNALLKEDALSDALVLVNEVGAISLDHLLVSEVREDVVVLASGCVCCSVRNDLVRALCDAYVKATRGAMKPFSRVFLETTGLADPTAVVQTLVKNGLVARGFHLSQIVVTFDATLGVQTLLRHEEAERQLTLADRIVLTKCDEVSEVDAERLTAFLHTRNPVAVVQRASRGETDLTPLCGSGAPHAALSGTANRVQDAPKMRSRLPMVHGADAADSNVEQGISSLETPHGELRTASLTWTRPLEFSALSAWVAMTTQMHGEHLLRLKGIFATTDDPRPTVVQAVQHVVYPPERLAAWPASEGAHESKAVVIARGMEKELFEALVASFQGLGG